MFRIKLRVRSGPYCVYPYGPKVRVWSDRTDEYSHIWSDFHSVLARMILY